MNYYELLGLAENATNDEIKRAYRLAIKKYHPDLHTNATPEQKKEFEAKTKEINEAYYVLSDNNRRSEYDLSLRTGRFGGGYYGGRNNGRSGSAGSSGQYDGPGGGYGRYGNYRQQGNWQDYGFSNKDFEDFFGKYGRNSGNFSKEEEDLKRQWDQFFRSNKSGGFYWGNSGPYNSDRDRNPYGNYRSSENPFRWGGRNNSWPFGGSSLLNQMFFMMLRRKMLGPFLFIVFLFLIIFGRYLFYFLILYLIYKALKWSIQVIAR